MKNVHRSIIITTNPVKHKKLEESRLVSLYVTRLLVNHTREVCDNYNIDSTHVHVNYVPINQVQEVQAEDDKVLYLVDFDNFLKAANNFIEESLFTTRKGHTDQTCFICVNFNVVFMPYGTIFITQETFAS